MLADSVDGHCIRDGASDCKLRTVERADALGCGWLLASISLVWIQKRVTKVQVLGNKLAVGTVNPGREEQDLVKFEL